jgi:hypothetical protein
MANEATLVPPYVSWGVFINTIHTLAETTVPTGPLDRRVLSGLSGNDHGALMSALRYLRLADSSKKATAAYRDLVAAVAAKNATGFSEKLLEILDTAYASIISKLDLEHGTISELEKAFKEDGVAQGQMLTKTIRFFVKAYTDGGGFKALSPHITKPSPKARSVAKNGADKARARTAKNAASTHTHVGAEKPTEMLPKGFGRLPIPGIENAFIQYPVDLTDAQCTLLEGAVAFLRVYVTGKIAGGGQKV